MKSKRSLMAVMAGLAILAAPITAAAFDNHGHHDSHAAAHASRSSNAPARSFAPAHNNVAPAVTRREFRDNAVAANRDWRANRAWADANAYRNYGRNYGNRGYYAAPGYAAGPGYYGAPGYAGGSSGCGQAQSVVNNYYRDRNTGHPAAAAELLARNQWAFHSGCAGAAPYAGGMFRGLGGYGGAPAYNNNGGYNRAYNGGYNGGGYNGGGYNGGYGQPYGSGSGLAPLLQQFIR
ncbi:MAG: hypothetical protein ABSB13_04075 [Candidatus Binatus sp.]|jgi:hypothetical protein|uniref:hypothetical protein n=1 Tax=Candidatus Binatus sp. TaxID=2811406 RepID=UPI003D117C0C